MTAVPEGVFVNDGARIRALDINTGELLWTTDLELGSSLSAAPAYHDGLLYHPHAGLFHVLDAGTGEVLYAGPVNNAATMQVTARDDVIFVQLVTGLAAIKPFREWTN